MRNETIVLVKKYFKKIKHKENMNNINTFYSKSNQIQFKYGESSQK